jgi:ACS family tartrate transporter-like MFS transporter
VYWFGLNSWRWLLIVEGFPAVLCGVLAFFLLPSRPAEAKFLAPEEKAWLAAELAREETTKLSQHQISVAQTFKHLRVWHLAFIEFTLAIGLYAIGFWLPQVIKSLSSHYSNTAVGFLSVIPQVVGLAAMILVSRSSDRHVERRYHAALSALLAGIAWLLLGTTSSPSTSLLFLSIIAAGVYSAFAPFWALPVEFLSGYAAASGIAMINSIAGLGGFVGPYAIGFIRDKTGSFYGGLTFVGASMMLSAILLVLLPKRAQSS